MKRFLLLLMLLLSSSVAASETHYTDEALECMKERKCTSGVEKVSLKGQLKETKTILKNLEQMGVEVYNAKSIYFTENYRALYFPDKNAIYINKKYINVEGELSFLQILRHEAWHAAQDCMAGTVNNSDISSIFSHEDIPKHIIEETFARYGYSDPEVIRIEREAVWVMYEPNMTIKALEACNSDTPIWETYLPPKRTWKYLYINSFLW